MSRHAHTKGSETMQARTYTVTEARTNLAEVINRVTYTEQPAVITKNGKDAVAVIPYRLLELLTRVEAVMDLKEAQKALDDYQSNGGLSLEQLKKELGLNEPEPTGGQSGPLPRTRGQGGGEKHKKLGPNGTDDGGGSH
jgi:prevent-host-death family protein